MTENRKQEIIANRSSSYDSYLLSIFRKQWQEALVYWERGPNIQAVWNLCPLENQWNVGPFWSIVVRSQLSKGTCKLSLWRDYSCRFCRGSSQWYALFIDVFMVPLWRCTFPTCRLFQREWILAQMVLFELYPVRFSCEALWDRRDSPGLLCLLQSLQPTVQRIDDPFAAKIRRLLARDLFRKKFGKSNEYSTKPNTVYRYTGIPVNRLRLP